MLPSNGAKSAYLDASNNDRDEILAAADLAGLFTDLVGPAGRNHMYRCPVHDGQTGQSPPVALIPKDLPTGWKCHSCGAKGTAIDLLVAARGLSVSEAFAVLRERTGIRRHPAQPGINRPRPVKPEPRHQPVPPAASEPEADNAVTVGGPEGAEILATYLAARGWRPELAAEADLSVVRSGSRTAIRHPFTVNGRTLGWQDRLIAGHGPKWCAPPGWRPVPHGLDQLAYRHPTELKGPLMALITEGPADALTVRSWWPYARVIGCPGTNGWNARHTAALTGAEVGLVFIAADNDEAGQRWITTMKEALEPHYLTVCPVAIPADYNDLTAWSTAAGNDFPAVFPRALKRAVGRSIGTPPRIAPLLGYLRAEAEPLAVAA